MKPQQTILFLCSGNFYRSRFAEEFFNHLARQKGLPWVADSRGLIKSPWLLGNFGAISPYAVKELEKRAIPVAEMRFPRCLAPGEADYFDLVVALDEDEHRPIIARDYPDLQQVTYWDIKDLGDESSESALGRLAAKVETLVERLG